MKPNINKLEKSVADWNSKYPVGTSVTRFKLINPLAEGKETVTRSEAWVMGGHSAMVMVNGVAGGVLLESVVPNPANAQRSRENVLPSSDAASG